jgi:hypothetical protein
VKALLAAFSRWYERHYLVNISIALFLFLLQIVHLIWLAVDVIAAKIMGAPLVSFGPTLSAVLTFVDYTEIPTLIATSLVYIYALKKSFRWKELLLLLALNTQWLHLFWITDEFVLDSLAEDGTILPPALAFVAIVIDYLEVPVIIDTIGKFRKVLKEGRGGEFLRNEFRDA